MSYKVIRFFTDLRDNNHPYNVGNTFPRAGVEVTDERLAELAGRNNAQRTPLIQFVKDEPAKPKAKRAKKSTKE